MKDPKFDGDYFELNKIATNVADDINRKMNNSILWAVDGTFINLQSNKYFSEVVQDIRALVIKKLKNY
tara:strand:+ start:275 stop:478 length:204 start_codon:yes stop_codon:yes gene_type:complete